MKKHSRTGSILRRAFNFRLWIDYDRVKSAYSYVSSGMRRLFVIQKDNQSAETFDEAARRLHLNRDELMKRKDALLRLSILMLVAACLACFYAVYQLMYVSYKSFWVSVVITLLALVLAFRYHFWYFQIKHAKLGCTLKEWFSSFWR